jgi:VanZ family protein
MNTINDPKKFEPLKLGDRYRYLIALTVALMTVLFFAGGPNYHSPRSFKSLWNLGHIIYFMVLPLLLISFYPNKRISPIFQTSLIIGATLALGILVEIFQYGFNRTPDMGDLFRNMIGAFIAICFILPIRESVPKPPMRVLRTIIVLLVASQFYPIILALIDEHHARRQFPILSDFQTPLQIQRWTGSAAITIENDIGHRGNRAMRADLTTQVYSGLALKYFPANWQQYQWFQFRIYNPSADAITMTCRIHDKKHTAGVQQYQDRFNKTERLSQGWNTITISLEEVRRAPHNRQMDLSQVYGVGIFASRLPQPRTIYIDDVRLMNP